MSAFVLFKELLLKSGVSEPNVALLCRYRDLVLKESEHQNLTKLLTDHDFFYGHMADCLELAKLNWIKGSCMDLGSGAGVPGIPFSILSGLKTTLVESEKRKAEFLIKIVGELGLSEIEVVHGRGEEILGRHRVENVLIRAVGPLERILDYVRKSSTWNKLILFKGPSFVEEEKVLKYSKNTLFKKTREHSYRVQDKSRLIVEIERIQV